MLFSLNKLEAFPLDRWMIRILEKYYSNFHLETKTITEKQYEFTSRKNCRAFWTICRICTTISFQNGTRKILKKNGCKPLKW